MNEEGSSVNEALQLENAARAREAGWLGFATLMAVMLVYVALISLLLLVMEFSPIIRHPDFPFPRFYARLRDFTLIPMPALAMSFLTISYFIFRAGRRRGVDFYHYGESAEGVGFTIYWLISVLVMFVFVWWLIFLSEGLGILNNPGIFLIVVVFVGTANLIPTLFLGYAWARLLEWSRKRWGKSLERLPIRSDSPKTP
jgi:hypothetical protein